MKADDVFSTEYNGHSLNMITETLELYFFFLQVWMVSFFTTGSAPLTKLVYLPCQQFVRKHRQDNRLSEEE